MNITLFGNLTIGIFYAWWFAAFYGIITGIFFIKNPKEFRSKVLRVPNSESKLLKVIFFICMVIFSRGLIVYSIFVPLQHFTPSFFIGTALAFTGLVLYAFALHSYAGAPQDRPATTGVYSLSRHPMQVMTILMWFGAGIAAADLIMISATIVLAVVSNFSFKLQEEMCLDYYGDAYRDYINKTPRYLFV